MTGYEYLANMFKNNSMIENELVNAWQCILQARLVQTLRQKEYISELLEVKFQDAH